jgi:hypothetical protein
MTLNKRHSHELIPHSYAPVCPPILQRSIVECYTLDSDPDPRETIAFGRGSYGIQNRTPQSILFGVTCILTRAEPWIRLAQPLNT